MKRERIIRPLLVSFTLLLGAVVLTGCASQPGVAAQVDGEIITEAQVEAVTSEIGHFYRDGGLQRTPTRIEAVDAFIFKYVLDSQQAQDSSKMGKLNPNELRSQLKQQIETACEQGKAQLKAVQQPADEKTNEAQADFEKQIKQLCDLPSKVDDLSDDAIIYEVVTGMKQSQGTQLAYPLLQQSYPDIDIELAPRYGTLTAQEIKRNAPDSVYFIPQQQQTM